jgi:hypothetical protein
MRQVRNLVFISWALQNDTVYLVTDVSIMLGRLPATEFVRALECIVHRSRENLKSAVPGTPFPIHG